ncbi:pri-1 [Pristionchus pacificus]|uniref:DNA primase n=1 Tax=Pristionchus pacificus TaxID=54126 RepID=A0A2A6BJ50_PRIPA|nr:pri-1 [Pristionchus pacificus]|eukprot:PDM65919.1 hypothetical protein PRIPAC_44198 [Pristionchus pacificus]
MFYVICHFPVNMTEPRPFEMNRLVDYLQHYYRKGVFPFKPYTNWLTYSKKPSEYFNLREFAFIIDKDGEEVHLRYRSFNDAFEFEKELCRVSPHKLDLGAVYNYVPKEGRNRVDFRAMERELIFDIDLNDYDSVRNCCEGATVCGKCWKFIVVAVKILDARLKKDFGFTALLYVFSGRRGVHCWVGDAKARKLTNSARSAFAEYLTLFEGDKMDLKGKGRGKTIIHPMITDCYNVIMTAENGQLVKDMVIEQSYLEKEEDTLKDCKNPQLKEELQRIFTLSKPESRWQMICLKCDEKTWRSEREKLKDQPDKLKNLPEPPSDEYKLFLLQWVLSRLYPRLDVNVSTGVNHLLKSPFCIHPKTGNVAVPIDAQKVHLFDVTKCPRIDQLLEELDKVKEDEGETKENRKMLAYKHTSLAPHVEIFEKFVEKTIGKM